MNRIVLSTVAVLVAVVGFAMVGEDQQANAGLFGRKCCKPACCEPAAPVCCEPACGGKKTLRRVVRPSPCQEVSQG